MSDKELLAGFSLVIRGGKIGEGVTATKVHVAAADQARQTLDRLLGTQRTAANPIVRAVANKHTAGAGFNLTACLAEMVQLLVQHTTSLESQYESLLKVSPGSALVVHLQNAIEKEER